MGNTQTMDIPNEGCTKYNTPQTRYLPRISDPRSPSDGIARTPIEVMRTPKASSSIQGTSLKFNTPNKYDTVDQCEDAMESEITEANVEPEQMASNIGTVRKPYLETDLDAVFAATDGALQHPRVKDLCTKRDSPSTFTETISTDVMQTDALTSRIDRISFEDVSIDDLSIVVSDVEEAIEADYKPVQDWLITLEDDRRSSIFESTGLPGNIHKQNKMVYEEVSVEAKENSFTTPENKSRSEINIRRPLSCLPQNKIAGPVASGTKATKVWRGIHEERERRGLSLLDENTPPPHPPVDKISSAPGKLIRRRRIVDWDQDSTMFI